MSTLDPEEAAAIGNPEIGEIAPTTRMGPVSLTVADLDRSLAYYARRRSASRRSERARTGPALGTGGSELLVLVEQPGAAPADGYTGLYHFALLVPGARPTSRAGWRTPPATACG